MFSLHLLKKFCYGQIAMNVEVLPSSSCVLGKCREVDEFQHDNITL
jgi:hypothetical protein